jgi:hypothetical protein
MYRSCRLLLGLAAETDDILQQITEFGARRHRVDRRDFGSSENNVDANLIIGCRAGDRGRFDVEFLA